MHSYTIKDLENLSGIKAHTIRIWEQRYSFLKPSRTGTNIRYYSNDELKTVLNIALLNKYGYKISHIDKMDESEIRQKILSLNQLEAQQERVVNELMRHMMDMDMEKFEMILDDYISSKGIDKAVNEVIFPFLEKIGILWQTNHIIPAQEHLVSNVIRQKLVTGIENIDCITRRDKTILLFLPEGEFHELALLYMHFCLKKRGICSIYLGCNITMDDVEYVVNIKKPDHLYTHLTTVNNKFNFDKFLTSLCQRFPNQSITVSGRLTHSYEKKVQPAIKLIRSFGDAMDYAAGL